MLLMSLLLVLTSVLAADLSPQELIVRLDSPDRVVREEATRTLEERGVEALPALRAAREATKEPEARERFADLIARVEARLLDRPTMVVLDVDDRPLGEAVQALATRSGFSLSLDDAALAGRRVTVRASGPLPFWEAVDRLGRAGHVRHDPGPRDDELRQGSPGVDDPPCRRGPSGSHRVFRTPSHPSLRHAPASRRELRGRWCLPRSAAERHGDRRGPGVRRARSVPQSQRPGLAWRPSTSGAGRSRRKRAEAASSRSGVGIPGSSRAASRCCTGTYRSVFPTCPSGRP